MRDAFGAAFVEEGLKAVWIKPNGTRRSADVIVAAEYRWYFAFKGEQNQSYEWMIQADQTQFVCANEQYYLLRDNDPVAWPTTNGKTFLDELAIFWRDWG